MALNINVSSSDWIDLRTHGYTSGMYLLNTVGEPIEYSTAATPVPGTTLVGSSAVLISGTYLWVRGSGDCELYTASEWAAANVKTVPVMVSTSSSGGLAFADQIPVVLFSTGVPFVLPAGDGGTNGLSFNGGGGGAFTFAAAPLAGLGSGLVGFPCFFYLPANAGGSGCASGWYYGTWSSDTTGVIYADRYVSGNPSGAIPKTPSTFSGNPSGRITQTTSAVNAVQGITLPAGAMGIDGELQWELMTSGDNSGSVKNYFWNIGGTQINREQSTSSPIGEKLISIHNSGVLNRQVASKWGRGIGLTDPGSPVFGSIDTAINNEMSVSMQVVANTATAVLLKTRWIVSKKN